MSSNKTMTLDFNIENLGPHTLLRSSNPIGSISTAIFANNGEGKTFISRAFRLASTPEDELSDRFLTLKKDSGKFSFKVTNPSDSLKAERELSIEFKRGSKPIINNNTDFLFHVFNHDYVVENLETLSYSPNEKIEGYILGKANIDVSKEKDTETKLKEKLANINFDLRQALGNATSDLDTLKIAKSTSEYKAISFENLISNTLISETDSFSCLKEKLEKLQSTPDDLKDVPANIYFNIDSSILNDIDRILVTSYSRST